MRYVRFWRGSADDFARVTHKNEDTMYFVIQPDTNSFTMYLGATELLNGDDLNSSSIDALEDVIISKKLYDRQVLMYDALQECWVNASLDKAAGAYVGPTAEYMGLPGMLPGAPAGSENLFFRSDGKWVEQHIEKVENIDKLQHIELIANITAQWPEVNKNDLIIIEDILFNNLKNDIAYWYDGKEWLSLANSSIPSDYAENDPQAPSHILNRPFYKETVTEPLEITWDGVWGGRPYASAGSNAAFVKLSDTVFDLEQLKDSYVTIFSSYGDLPQVTIPFSSLEVTSIDLGTGFAHVVTSDGLPVLAILTNDVFFEGNSCEKGTYFGIVRLSDNDEGDYTIYSIYTASLSFPSVTYEKYYKLDNNFVDAEWMATESAGVGTKKFSLVNFSDVLAVGGVVQNFPLVYLDSRPYTEEELKGARLTFDTENFPVACTVANTVTIDNGLAATMLCIADDAVYLFSMEEDVILDEIPLKKGLYILTDAIADFSEVSNITLEIFNTTGQTIPNKLPNKFLDLDWVPKADTYAELLYEGTIEGEGREVIPLDPQLLDLDTTLLLTANGVTIEARAAGTPLFGVIYLFRYTEEEFIAVSSDGTAAYLDYIVAEPMGVSIGIVKKAANPIPRHFLPEGVGNKVVVEIDHPLADGLGGYEATIEEAWNSGATVELQFTDAYLTLLSLNYLPLDGIFATAVTAGGRVYLFDPLARENGWALNIHAEKDNPASVLYKAEGSTEFVPTALNATLTEGSTLPAQEGAVFTAIQEIKNLITPINEALEAALEGGN